MPVYRGTLRKDEGGSANGKIFFNQSNDTPDDAIIVDLRKDEESLNWTKYTPDDSRERFCEWSDEKALIRLTEAREKLRKVRSGESGSEEG